MKIFLISLFGLNEALSVQVGTFLAGRDGPKQKVGMDNHQCKVICQRFGFKTLGSEFDGIKHPTDCVNKCNEVYKPPAAKKMESQKFLQGALGEDEPWKKHEQLSSENTAPTNNSKSGHDVPINPHSRGVVNPDAAQIKK